MPNWCNIYYGVSGNKEERKRFLEMLEYLNGLPKPYVENSFGNLWCGCIVSYLGGNWEEMDCRGTIRSYWIDKNYISFTMDCAWGELRQWRAFLEEKFPGLKFLYQAIEISNQDFYTNDVEGVIFPEKYFVGNDNGDEYLLKTLDDVAKRVSKITKSDVLPTKESIMAAISAYSNGNDKWISFHEFIVMKD